MHRPRTASRPSRERGCHAPTELVTAGLPRQGGSGTRRLIAPSALVTTGLARRASGLALALVVFAGAAGSAHAVPRNTTNGYRLGGGLALGFDDTAKQSKVIAQSLRTGKRVDTDLQCGAPADADPVQISGGLVLAEPHRVYLEVRVDKRGAPGTACDRIYQAGIAAGALDPDGRGRLVLVSDDLGRTWFSLPRPPDLGLYGDDIIFSPRPGAVLQGDPVEGWWEWSSQRPEWTRAYSGKTFGYYHPEGRDFPPELRGPRLPGGSRYFDFVSTAQGARRNWVLYGYGGAPIKKVRSRVGSRTRRSRLSIPAPVFSRTGYLPTQTRCRTGPFGRSNTLQQAIAQSSANGRVVWGVSGLDGVARCGRRRVNHGLLPRLIISRNYGRTWRAVRTPRAARRSLFLLAVDGASPVITTPGCRGGQVRWWRLKGRRWAKLGCHPKSSVEDE